MGSSLRTAYIFLMINFIVFIESTNFHCSSFPSFFNKCWCTEVDLYLNFYCAKICTPSFNTPVIMNYKPNDTLEILCFSDVFETINYTRLNDEDYIESDDMRDLLMLESFEILKPIENLNMLPDLNVGSIKTVVLKHCPIPEKVFQKFGITKVLNVLFEGSSNISDTSKYFDSISGDVEALKLIENKIKVLDGGTFSKMTNLITLDLSNNVIRSINTQLNNLENLKHLNLSGNEIITLSKESFSCLTNLGNLDLSNNSIFELPDGVFDDLTNLKSLDLSKNRLRNISENIFKNLINLEELNLGFNQFIELRANIFSTNNKLKKLILNKNNLTVLPEGLIENLKVLESLQLNGNSLTTLPNDLFKSFPNLLMVDLSYNQISSELTNQFLSLAPELQKLHLQNNQLNQIQTLVFNRNTKLVELNLSQNKLTLNELKINKTSFLSQCTDLENLDLSYNEIDSINFFLKFGFTKPNLKTLDMGHNKIEWVNISELTSISNNNLEINLENNLIARVELGNLEKIANSSEAMDDSNRSINSTTVIRINSNPIICNCHVFDLVKYLNSSIKSSVRNLINIKADNLSCGGLQLVNDYVGMKVESLNTAMLTCRVDTCPEYCVCIWRPHDKGFFINCSNRDLKSLPIIEEPKTEFLIDFIEINLENNSIETFPRIMGYEKVTVLRLSHNEIRELTWIPPKVKVLNLDHNNLSRLSVKLLKNLHNTTLHNNPWICDCKIRNLSVYIKNHSIPEKSNIVCKESNLKLTLLLKKDLCPDSIIFGATSVSVLILLTAVLCRIYYKMNQGIITAGLTNHNNVEMKADPKTDAYIKWSDYWIWNRLIYALSYHKNKQNPNLDKSMDNIDLHFDSMENIKINSTPNIESKLEHIFLTKEQLNLRNAGDITSIPA